MAIITAQKFANNCNKLRGEELAELVSATFAYALFHFRKDGQKTPYNKMVEAVTGSKSMMADVIARLKLTKGEASEEAVIREADAQTAFAMADTATIRAIRKEQREARKAAKAAKATTQAKPAPVEDTVIVKDGEDGAPAVIEGEAKTIEVHSALIIGGETVELTAGEADALYDALCAIRAGQNRAVRLAA